ncbi:SRPBCC family protein [Kribbella sp. NPDC056861]|uniref:SRPBCC family protein n=1 Tax=Kribbella sp. NPDC056861 TaxID=3154857 RepID=UPI003433910F
MGNTIESVDVEAPITAVYNQWTQFESFPQFMDGVDEVKQLDDTHTHWVTSMAGVKREFDATITEQHPEERVAWASDSEPRHAGVITFHRIDDTTTRVTAQMDLDPEGFAEQVADKTGLVGIRVKRDLLSFKEFIEKRGSETGGWRGDVERPDQAR